MLAAEGSSGGNPAGAPAPPRRCELSGEVRYSRRNASRPARPSYREGGKEGRRMKMNIVGLITINEP